MSKDVKAGFKTTIGGQAIIEGIVMKGPEKSATVVRNKDGELVVKIDKNSNISDRYPILKWPIIRGIFGLAMAMKDGISAINYSSQFIDMDDAPTRLEIWMEKKFGKENCEKFSMTTAMILGIIIPIVLFMLLPTILTGFMSDFIGNDFLRNIVEGVIRISIFIVFLYFTSKMKDVERTFMYHGAEHKTIHCYEAGEELTVENVRRQPRQHPRCGTSFLFVVMIISILVFSVITWTNPLTRVLLRIILLPLVIGIAYEVNRIAGRHDNFVTKLIRYPGMMIQNLTTFEPTDDMIEVAIEGLMEVIPSVSGADKW